MKYTFRSRNSLTAFVILIVVGLIFLLENPAFGQISVRNVNSIIIDDNNVKWFSTDVGIVSFDGNNWTLFNDNTSLPEQDLKSLTYVANPEGPELWIASPHGATVTSSPVIKCVVASMAGSSLFRAKPFCSIRCNIDAQDIVRRQVNWSPLSINGRP